MPINMPAHIASIMQADTAMAQAVTLLPTSNPTVTHGLLYHRQLSASAGDYSPRAGTELVLKVPRTSLTLALKAKDLVDAPLHLGSDTIVRYQVVERRENPYPLVDLVLRRFDLLFLGVVIDELNLPILDELNNSILF